MGALGRVYGNGDLDLALTIRTFAIAEGRIHLWVGGGVVWDSDPAAEIAESWVKADPLLRAIGAPRRGRREPPATRGVGARGRTVRRAMSGDGLLAVAVSGRGLVEPGEPVLAADDEGFTRGRAAFETMRVYGGRPFRFEQHVDASASARPSGSASSRPTARRSSELSALALEQRGRSRGGAAALLDARPAGAGATARSPSSARSRPGSRRRARAASGSSRCSTSAGRRRGCCRRRSRRATPSASPPRRRRRRAAPTTRSSSTRDGIVLEGPVTNIWWREGDVLSPRRSRSASSPARRAPRCSSSPRARARRSRRASSRSSGCSRPTRSSRRPRCAR